MGNFYVMSHIFKPNAQKAHSQLISNAPAKSEVNLLNGCGTMQGTDRQTFRQRFLISIEGWKRIMHLQFLPFNNNEDKIFTGAIFA